LGGEDGGHQELERRFVIELAVGIGMGRLQPLQDGLDVFGGWFLLDHAYSTKRTLSTDFADYADKKSDKSAKSLIIFLLVVDALFSDNGRIWSICQSCGH
jgi:hypothetical protein